jgi:hypothetical protein
MLKHLTLQLRKANYDVAQTCELADIAPEMITQIIVSALLAEAIHGMAVLEMSETQFIALCRRAYRQLYPEISQSMGR